VKTDATRSVNNNDTKRTRGETPVKTDATRSRREA
jgi:hypothetical protein